MTNNLKLKSLKSITSPFSFLNLYGFFFLDLSFGSVYNRQIKMSKMAKRNVQKILT